MIKVAIVDDQTLVRQGIVSLLSLSKDLTVVAEFNHGDELLPWLADHKPDVILLDLRMPVCNGVETLKKMRAAKITIPVIILTTFDDDEGVIASIEAGARGYLLKDVALDELLDAVKAVHQGKSIIKPVAIPDKPIKTDVDPLLSVEPLSAREQEVLQLMSAGFSNKEIARALELAEGTVKNYISEILAKLGVRDRTRAVLKAMEHGLL
ncbi:response regulator [Permianibacter aggregans]|uniref:LuxR family two component transcriptional regulator n=1 Tax=Permianibacter aggregans TaxID=1510150 RepID=A0A4R6UMR6_9GAMM|nr:response regulator transcription factor [Permianibacter aggregans]QGX40786.1 response regulator transcription factor [Permianibacter aggregans]TDQ48398.1 LuxR family two component transcriptional regulator [Permianibacter aggregans]